MPRDPSRTDGSRPARILVVDRDSAARRLLPAMLLSRLSQIEIACESTLQAASSACGAPATRWSLRTYIALP